MSIVVRFDLRTAFSLQNCGREVAQSFDLR